MNNIFSLNIIPKNIEVITEAVFKDGKQSLQPIVEKFQAIKDILNQELQKSKDKFDPEKFLKRQEFKDLEDELRRIFGFRNVEIFNWLERYDNTNDRFESCDMNCVTYTSWRYPIVGLVTDKGFYDSTHSINTSIYFSLGALLKLTAEELVATFLHEFGHNIDPALVDIKYTETNILSKYLTNRKLSAEETKATKELGVSPGLIMAGIMALVVGFTTFIAWIKKKLFNQEKALSKLKEKLIEVEKKSKFNPYENSEAFADNFARMYGFGPQLMTALTKMDKNDKKYLTSRAKNEKERQKILIEMIDQSAGSDHKTLLHRFSSLQKEYEKDLKDPNIPDKVKDDIQGDLDELKAVVSTYMNSKDTFEKRLNSIIMEAINKETPEEDPKPEE